MKIHAALEAGDDPQINHFLKNCSSSTVNTRNEDGLTPLHIACSTPKYLHVVKRLLKKKALVNCSDTRGFTPLHIAAKHQCYETCSLLIRSKANIHAMTDNKDSVLSFLVQGDDIQPTRLSIINTIIPTGLNQSNSSGETPFFLASKYANDTIVELLLQHNPDLHVRTNTGETVLHYAVHLKCPIVVKLLCDAKADVSAMDNEGNTPADVAQTLDPMIASYLRSRAGELTGNVKPPVSPRCTRIENRSPFHSPTQIRDPKGPQLVTTAAPVLVLPPSLLQPRKSPTVPPRKKTSTAMLSHSPTSPKATKQQVTKPPSIKVPHTNPKSSPRLSKAEPIDVINISRKGDGTSRVRSRSLSPRTREEYRQSRAIMAPLKASDELSICLNQCLMKQYVSLSSYTSTLSGKDKNLQKQLHSLPMNESCSNLPKQSLSTNRINSEIQVSEPRRSVSKPASWRASVTLQLLNQPVRIPDAYVTVPPPNDLEDGLHGVWNVYEELVATEYTYLRDLAITILDYKQPLEVAGIVSEEDIHRVFWNIGDLYELANQLYHQLLQDKQHSLQHRDPGAIFLRNMNQFSDFEMYCTNQVFASSTINELKQSKKFRDFLREKQETSHSKEDICGLLIKPFQRVCRYVLLLKEIESSIPENWVMKKSLQDVKSHIQKIVHKANESKRIMDNEISLQTIRNNLDTKLDPERASKLVGETDVREYCKGKLSKRHLFLFNNLLLVIKKTPKGKYATKYSIPLDKCLLWDTVESKERNALQIVRTDTPEKLILVFVSEALKNSWITKINDCIAMEGCM